MNNAEEISIISKLVNQQNGLMDALTDCHSLKKQLSSQFIKILKAITLKNNGILVIEKEFFDSADDEEIDLNIESDEEENIVLEITDTEEEENDE